VTIIAIVSAAVAFTSYFLFLFAGQRVANRIKRAYFDSLTRQEIGYFDIKKSGALAHAMSEDITKVTDAITIHLQQVIF
jgi:ATP-binding cassette subfamily B (MDR/TAP) protein 1